MRQSAWILVLIAAVGLSACGKKNESKVPAPPPVAPATPPPAPPPSTSDVPQQVDDYARIKGMSTDEIDRLGLLGEIHFDYDSADIRDSDRAILSKNAEALKKYDFLKVSVEGHCDERGSVEYNLALGERRARSASDYLVQLGVPSDRLKNVSYGKEVPLCQEAAESCWARNRRARFTVSGKTAR